MRAAGHRAHPGTTPAPSAAPPRASRSPVATLIIGAVRAYQLCLSPWLGRSCRYVPSCSAYAIEAVARFGALRGAWLAVRRIGRCHPWGGSGYDPVAEAPRAERPLEERGT